MPCTRSCVKRSSALMPEFCASFAAVSTDITTSPKSCGAKSANSPARMGKAITLVGPRRLKYFLFSRSICGSSTRRRESSPSGQSKAFKMAWAFPFIFFRDILCLFWLLSIRTPIFSFSVDQENLLGIFNAVVVYSV